MWKGNSFALCDTVYCQRLVSTALSQFSDSANHILYEMPLIPHPAYPVEAVVCLSNQIAARLLYIFHVVNSEVC